MKKAGDVKKNDINITKKIQEKQEKRLNAGIDGKRVLGNPNEIKEVQR